MFEFRCPACAALAYSSALEASRCPACGVDDLEAIGIAGRADISARPAEPLELVPPAASAPMNASVQAVRAAQGLGG